MRRESSQHERMDAPTGIGTLFDKEQKLRTAGEEQKQSVKKDYRLIAKTKKD